MKLQRIFMLGCMVMAIALVSCSGEDGKDGLDGIDGTDGATGPTGAAGDNGTDGVNCWDLNGDGVNDPEEDINGDEVFDALDCQGEDGEGGQGTTAERIIVDVTGIAANDTNPSLSVPELTQSVLDTHVILAYLSDGLDYFPVPGRVYADGFVDRQFDIQIESGRVILIVSNFDGFDLTAGWVTNVFSELHLVLIETTPFAGKSQEDIMSSLKNLGVDTSDYKEVVRYFGLDQ